MADLYGKAGQGLFQHGLFDVLFRRREMAKEAELRALAEKQLRLELAEREEELAQQKRLGEIYPLGFEPTPSTHEVTLTPAEEELQREAYVPPPTTPPQTKMGYPGITTQDYSTFLKRGLTPLPPIKGETKRKVMPTWLVQQQMKEPKEPAVKIEDVKDDFGNVVGRQVFKGEELVKQYDMAGREIPIGQPIGPQAGEIPRLAKTEEESRQKAPPAPLGFINITQGVYDPKGRELGFKTTPERDPTFTVSEKGYPSYEQAAEEGQKALTVLSKSDPTRYKAHTVVVDQVGQNQFRFKIQPPSMAAAALGALPVGTPEQIEQDIRAITSPIPSLTLEMVSKGGGMGGIGAAYARQIRAEILKRNPGFNFILQEALVTGTKTSLTNLYKIHAISDVAREAAEAHAKTISKLALRKNDMGVPAIDRWFRAGKKAIKGDIDVTNLDLAIHHYDTEIARYLASMTQGGVLSEREAERYRNLITAAMRPEQIIEALQTVNELMLGKDQAFIISKKRVANTLRSDFGFTDEELRRIESEMRDAPVSEKPRDEPRRPGESALDYLKRTRKK